MNKNSDKLIEFILSHGVAGCMRYADKIEITFYATDYKLPASHPDYHCKVTETVPATLRDVRATLGYQLSTEVDNMYKIGFQRVRSGEWCTRDGSFKLLRLANGWNVIDRNGHNLGNRPTLSEAKEMVLDFGL